MINIGIDPGVGGGVAVIENGYIEAFNCHDTVKDMADYINKHRWDCINMFCVIEKVHSMPGQGVVSKYLKHLAQSLYPNIKITLKTADAVLIAHWCRQIAPDISDSPVGAGFIKK